MALKSKQSYQIQDEDDENAEEKKDDSKLVEQMEIEEEPEREMWGNKLDFMLSCIGYAVGLGNVWRFPYLCYQNGGGAFLLPYLIFLVLCGMPLFFMELSIGQYMSLGPIGCWRALSPGFQGIGYAMLVVSFLVSIYYNVIIAWCLYFLFQSFRSEVPWKHCRNSWNTDQCAESAFRIGTGINTTVVAAANATGAAVNATGSAANSTGVAINSTVEVISCLKDYLVNETFVNGTVKTCLFNGTIPKKRISPSAEYWTNYVLELTDGIDDSGGIKWQLALTLLLAWVIVYFCMWKGVKSAGKVVYFTATFPYVVLFVLFIRGVTLPGAAKGVEFYLKPDFKKLQEPQVWVRAASQIFYSLGVGFGSLIAMGSYNKFHNNCFKDAITVSVINCSTSVFAGFVIFSVLGHMSHVLNVPVDKVVDSGPGLAFVAYPEGIAQMPVSPLWAILFFFMLLTLGLDSQFAMMECVATSLADEYPVYLRKYKELFILGISVTCYIIGLSNVTRAGAYVLNLFDYQSGGVSLLFLAFFEAVCIGWFYGTDRLSDNIEQMIGHRPGLWWTLCWKYFSPAIILGVFFFSLYQWTGIVYGDYVYPDWAEALGWLLACSSMICIPLGFLGAYYKASGSSRERFTSILRPDPEVIQELQLKGSAMKSSPFSKA